MTAAFRRPRTSLQDSIRALGDRRLHYVFILGLASGFPWLLIGSAMTAWLQEAGLTRTTIGLFGMVYVPYTINMFWAPLVDGVRLPVIGSAGLRRSWILLCQGLIAALTLLLAAAGPTVSPTATAVVALGIAAASATQDLAIDAYRIGIIRDDEPALLGHAAAMATCGWWTGASLPGVAAFWLVDLLGWAQVYMGLACVPVLITLLFMWQCREPPRQPATDDRRQDAARLARNYVDAVAEFFRRHGWRVAAAVLSFIALFKIGEAFLGRMVVVFYKEVGFSNADIGTYAQGLGLLVTCACSIAAGILAGRYGVARTLVAAGIAMAGTNLLFSWIAVAGPDPRILAVAVVADGITSAFSTVAFVAFISSYVGRLHTATQYGALASLGTTSRTLLATSSGLLVDGLDGDWALFFVITAVMATPSLLILTWLIRAVGTTPAPARSGS